MSDSGDDAIEIERIETLSAEKFPLRKVRFAQRRQDGARESVEREVYELPQSAVVLPIDRRRGTMLLARQLRLPPYLNGDSPRLIEACAGHIEAGDDAAETARREAEEELGYRLDALTPLFVLYPSPALVTEKMHVFLAEYDPSRRISEGGGLAEEGEDIETVELTLDEAWRMVASGDIVDIKTVLLVYHLKLSGALDTGRP